jgi:alkyl hydroperoxide reductase subunit AhpC
VTVARPRGTSEEVTPDLRGLGVSYPVLNDPAGATSALWGVHSVPASFIIAPDGTVRFVEVGYTSEVGLRLRLWLARW